MRQAITLTLTAALLLAHATSQATELRLAIEPPPPTGAAHARLETLWIFDADFEDLLGDNAGWTSYDRSGTLAVENHWHKDTIRINGFEHLGDSTWWCGTYDPCWRQPRGYGNDWSDLLVREFPEVAAATSPGDPLELRFDQRVAMENAYDYGYVDIRSPVTGNEWHTLVVFDNPGFMGTPGISQDWDSENPECPGHVELDLTDYSGYAFDLRFRFESDGAYSSQDQRDNPPWHSVLDGAWQLDNIKLVAWTPDSVLVFLDDCESPGDNGWVHDGVPAHGQTGVTFWRGLYGTDIWTNRPYTCDEQSGWMYAAVDPLTSRMVDNEYAWLMSPPIDIAGATKLVGQWSMWVDLPRPTNDIFDIQLASNDDDCWEWWWDPWEPGWWYGGPFWGTWTDDWDAFAGNDMLRVLWLIQNDEPPDPGVEHMGGIFLNRFRAGVPSGDPGTTWSYGVWDRFNDWFVEEMAQAMLDSAVINVRDGDDVVSVLLVADNGATQTSYPCRRIDPFANDWICPPPATEMLPGSEIHYYFEAVDGVGVTSTFPAGAPDRYYEFSILPIRGSVGGDAILLVDKHGRVTPGEQRDYAHFSQDYYEEALDVLGYEYDVYDVAVPSGSIMSDGPDTSGLKYYDTQIWFASAIDDNILNPADQWNLIQWLSQAGEGKERNLLLTGNNLSADIGGADSLSFAADWLAAQYLEGSVGTATSDTVPGLRDVAGGFDFMTFDDGECVLRGGCPELEGFDVVQPYPGSPGTEVVAEYVKEDMTTRPAGVAHTHALGFQTVTLGFGVEFMSDTRLPSGYFVSGASDRVSLLGNIMEYFGKTPTATPTDVESCGALVNHLAHPRPNPFNPSTTIEFSLAADGRALIRVHNAAGRVVRTLVDQVMTAGPHAVVWDGLNDAGQEAASGVYFVRMEANGPEGSFTRTRKLVLLQ